MANSSIEGPEAAPLKGVDTVSGGEMDSKGEPQKSVNDKAEGRNDMGNAAQNDPSIVRSEDDGAKKTGSEQSHTGPSIPHPLPPLNQGIRLLANNLRHFGLQEIGHIRARPDESAAFLAKYLKTMDWLYHTMTNDRSMAPPLPKPRKTITVTPEIKLLSWKEWEDPKLCPSYTGPGGPETYSSLYILAEEPPIPQRIDDVTLDQGIQTYNIHTDSAAGMGRRSGMKVLPPRIRIASVAGINILDAICGDKLRIVNDTLVVILRPFKLLLYHEDSIRKWYDELRMACDEDRKDPEAKTKLSDAHNEIRLPNPPAGVERISGKHNMGGLFSRDINWDGLDFKQREEAAREFGFIVSFMDEYVAPMTRCLQSSGDNIVYFHDMWHLFRPGSLVYVNDVAVPQKIWQVLQGTGGRRPMMSSRYDILSDKRKDDLALGALLRERANSFQMDCFHLDFNGTSYVRVRKTFTLEEFTDYQEVKTLPILPIQVAEQEGLVDRESILRRGENFIRYTKPRYAYYRGRSLSHRPDGCVLRRPQQGTFGSIAVLSEVIESPVVVDFERCLQAIPDWLPKSETLELSKTPASELGGDHGDGLVDDDRIWDVRLAERVLNFNHPTQDLDYYHDKPNGDDVLLLPDRVFGFILRTRRWACLQIGLHGTESSPPGLKTMKPNLEAWDHLEINQGHRSVIESLMATHFGKAKSHRRQFDLVQDKGKGIILLLHGVPGVGKTSTAETVAEYYNKPLLPITCGDLGLIPAEVETNLQISFQMAQAWDCVLLLDEADVFLAERSRENIERNALVSVFLRVLEYYEGILFLTTNKVGSFDEAFKSRISMALYYPPLDQAQTLAIWKTQMRRTIKNSQDLAPNDPIQHIDFDQPDIEMYAQQLWFMQQNHPQYKPVWNGRQIRNAFQAAVAIAEFHREPGHHIKVTRAHFTKIADVSNEFNYYLWRTKHQRNDEVLNRRNQYRDDAFEGGFQFGSTPMPPNIGVQLYQNPQASGMPQSSQQQQYPPPPGMPQASSSFMMGFPVAQDPMPAQTMAQFQPIGGQAPPNMSSSQPHLMASQASSSANPMGAGQSTLDSSMLSDPQRLPTPQSGQQVPWNQGLPLPQMQPLAQQRLQRPF